MKTRGDSLEIPLLVGLSSSDFLRVSGLPSRILHELQARRRMLRDIGTIPRRILKGSHIVRPIVNEYLLFLFNYIVL